MKRVQCEEGGGVANIILARPEKKNALDRVAADELRLCLETIRESPTVRGLVGLLAEALDGAPPEDVAAVPDDLLNQLGIAQQLGMRRQQGFAGVLHALKRSVAEAAA